MPSGGDCVRCSLDGKKEGMASARLDGWIERPGLNLDLNPAASLVGESSMNECVGPLPLELVVFCKLGFEFGKW